MADLSGTSLGQYQLLECISQGAVAAVYKASQPALARHVVLKVILFPTPAQAELFRQRCEPAVKAVSSPEIGLQ